jgi:phosphate transport system permease protein
MTSPESPAAVEAPALGPARSTADGAEPSSRPVPVADRPSPGDHVFKWALTGAALAIPTLLLFLLYELSTGSRLAIDKFGLHFLVDSIWDPVAEKFGAYPLIFGTLLSSFLALLIAVPLSLGVAIYLTEFAPRVVRQPVAFVIELLAAIPSVVYGLWGVFVLMPVLKKVAFPLLRDALGWLPFFQGPIYGPSMLSASIILSIMVMPFIMAVSREVLLAVPGNQREAALALGATRWEAVWTTILPYARSGIMGAVVLGLGRALGETMAVTMLIGNRHEIAASLFAPGYTMAAVIANEFSEAATDMHFSALTYVALVLFVVTVLVNAGARLLIWRVARGSGVGSKAL